MKKISLILGLFMICSTMAFGQTNNNKFQFGFSLDQIQNDFGFGVQVISPYFANSKVAIRLGANLQFFQFYNGDKTTWSPYENIQVGIRGRQYIIDNKLFAYGEGGLIFLFPNNDFSTDAVCSGGYGLFGFEFEASKSFSYFIELGAVGTGARADKLPTKPIYSNGFFTNVGFRITL